MHPYEQGHAGDYAGSLVGADAGDSPLALIAAVIVAALVVLVVLPLHGVALELIALLQSRRDENGPI